MKHFKKANHSIEEALKSLVYLNDRVNLYKHVEEFNPATDLPALITMLKLVQVDLINAEVEYNDFGDPVRK